MKERIKGAFTKKKIFHFLKMALFVVALSLILLSLLGTVAHATGLVDDTINAENLYSKYPLSNYQLDFYVDRKLSRFIPAAVAADQPEGAVRSRYAGSDK